MRISPRLAGNLIYTHRLSQCEHAEGCGEGGDAADCDIRRFHEWLDAPLFPWEQREHARFVARRAALMRGEIPA